MGIEMGKLNLKRRRGESVTIGEHITILVEKCGEGGVSLRITAPKDVAIGRPDMKKTSREGDPA